MKRNAWFRRLLSAGLAALITLVTWANWQARRRARQTVGIDDRPLSSVADAPAEVGQPNPKSDDVEFDSLAAMARRNLELEARYGGDLSHGRERPMTGWERLKHVVSVVASTGPAR